MYGTYKLPAFRQNCPTRQKGREILTHPLILTKTARDTLKPLCISLHRLVPNVNLLLIP